MRRLNEWRKDVAFLFGDWFWRAFYWLDNQWYNKTDWLLRPWRVAADYDEDLIEITEWVSYESGRVGLLAESVHQLQIEDVLLSRRAMVIERHVGLPVRYEDMPPTPERVRVDDLPDEQEELDLEEQELYAFGYTPGPGGL